MKVVIIALNEVYETGKMDIHIQVQEGMGGMDKNLTVNCDQLIKHVRNFEEAGSRIFSDTIEILEILVYDDSVAKDKLLEMIDAMVGEKSKHILG